jgi:hypothetical protein
MLGHVKTWATTDANALRKIDIVDIGNFPGKMLIGMLNFRT